MSLAKSKNTWSFVTAAPSREVFAVMEQMLGTWPYRYEVSGTGEARIIEVFRNGLFGQVSRRVRKACWVRCAATPTSVGTEIVVESSAGEAPLSRALQLVEMLSRGNHDRRTIYRSRNLPPGPVTLVASWAGMAYPLYAEPHFDSPRSTPVHTATRLEAIPGATGPFIKVRLGDGTEGYMERDQVVAAPESATRQAQQDVARFG